MPRYGMVLITNLCTGCQTCSVACKMENLTLPGCARTVVTERMDATWEIGICMQCDNPPCVSVCPAKATWKNQVGVIVVDQNKCIGCRQCVGACPYNARRVNSEKGYFEKPLPFEKYSQKVKETHRNHAKGKVDKCDFCIHRIEKKLPPMCVEACTTEARVFGDLDDPQSEVARLLAKGATPRKAELGTKPKVFYL
jgi:Fe-S-cluster-containing dehydrogenase component